MLDEDNGSYIDFIADFCGQCVLVTPLPYNDFLLQTDNLAKIPYVLFLTP